MPGIEAQPVELSGVASLSIDAGTSGCSAVAAMADGGTIRKPGRFQAYS